MRVTPELLRRVARETVQKRLLAEPDLVAAYLTGSVRHNEPFLGGITDIDLVLVHQKAPAQRREIVPLPGDFSLDIFHYARAEYDKPRELRLDPWRGPELYDPLPLHTGQQHFFEFVQAGVRDRYHEPENVLSRARRNAEQARQRWTDLLSQQDTPWPTVFFTYLESILYAANTVAVLSGEPLAERGFLLQFPERAAAAGKAHLAATLLALLGANEVEVEALSSCVSAWEKDFLEAANRPRRVEPRISAARLQYYKKAFVALLDGDTPYAILWPLLFTWTLAVQALPVHRQETWESVCKGMGLIGKHFEEKIEQLDGFLDAVEEVLDSRS